MMLAKVLNTQNIKSLQRVMQVVAMDDVIGRFLGQTFIWCDLIKNKKN